MADSKKLNILIAGEGKTLPLLIKSKYLNKLYITSNHDIRGAISINFNTFQELADKCRALKVDIVIAENEKWILQGIADVLRRNLVNCFALNSRGDRLVLSAGFAKKLLNKYNILTPGILAYPAKYPVVVRSDRICKIGYSLDEIIKIKEDIAKQSEEDAKTIFLEEFIDGEPINLVSLFDGKNLLSFSDNILMQEYSQKLCNLLTGENLKFIGFLTSKLIVQNNKIYALGFSSVLPDLDINIDFIYLLNAAIYQKLDEIQTRY